MPPASLAQVLSENLVATPPGSTERALLHSALQDTLVDLELAGSINSALFALAESREEAALDLLMELLPSLLQRYLFSLHRNEQSPLKLGTTLLALYNKVVLDAQGKSVCKTFSYPSTTSSVYHRPDSTVTSSIVSPPNNARSNVGKRISPSKPTRVTYFGPFPAHSTINCENRFSILSVLLQCYHSLCGKLSLQSLHNFANCSATLLKACHGCNTTQPGRRPSGRLALDQQFVLHIVHILIYSTHHGCAAAASDALKQAVVAASYYLWPTVLITINAVSNCEQHSRTSRGELPVINQPLSVITNANWVATKLPDDIEALGLEGASDKKSPDPRDKTAGKSQPHRHRFSIPHIDIHRMGLGFVEFGQSHKQLVTTLKSKLHRGSTADQHSTGRAGPDNIAMNNIGLKEGLETPSDEDEPVELAQVDVTTS